MIDVGGQKGVKQRVYGSGKEDEGALRRREWSSRSCSGQAMRAHSMSFFPMTVWTAAGCALQFALLAAP